MEPTRRDTASWKVFEDEFVTVWVEPVMQLVWHRIHQVPDSASFRAMLSAGAEAMEKHHATKWLSDDRLNTVVRDDDSQWAETVWKARVIKAGFRYWAIVLPAAAIGKLNMRRYAEMYKKLGVEVRAFGDYDLAREWILAAGGSNS